MAAIGVDTETSRLTKPGAPAPARRSQAERRAAMRERLLTAAIDCLVDGGYVALTTAEVETRAAVSRGARMHYYRTKAELLSAAVEHLFAVLREEFVQDIPSDLAIEMPERERFGTVIRLLWAKFLDPRVGAVLELITRARSDDPLRLQLQEILTRWYRGLEQISMQYFPENQGFAGARAVFQTLYVALSGLVLRRVVYGGDAMEHEILETIESAILAHLDEARGLRS